VFGFCFKRKKQHALFVVGLLGLFAGCRTAHKSAPIDLSGPGWQLRQGQAIWRSKREAPEIAGEVVLATHPDGAAFVQFSKNPLPLLTGQISPQGWRAEFIPEQRIISGRGTPPSQLIWLHLLRSLQGIVPSDDFTFSKSPDGSTRLENRWSGEQVNLFLQ
jgi:hypothetical protein